MNVIETITNTSPVAVRNAPMKITGVIMTIMGEKSAAFATVKDIPMHAMSTKMADG